MRIRPQPYIKKYRRLRKVGSREVVIPKRKLINWLSIAKESSMKIYIQVIVNGLNILYLGIYIYIHIYI